MNEKISNDLVKRLIEQLMEQYIRDIEDKIKEFERKLEQASNDPNKFIEAIREIRIFFEGLMTGESNPLMRLIGQLWIGILRLTECFLDSTLIYSKILNELKKQVDDLEKRIEKLEKDFYPID